MKSQLDIIKTCFELYRFIDYIHDRKKYVPINYQNSQPAKYMLDAFFNKMKADHMRYIYECLDGDNGLLANVCKNVEHNFHDALNLIS